jgi:hypothetical protein
MLPVSARLPRPGLEDLGKGLNKLVRASLSAHPLDQMLNEDTLASLTRSLISSSGGGYEQETSEANRVGLRNC